MKKILLFTTLSCFILLLLSNKRYNNLSDKYLIATQNIKAYQSEISNNGNSNKVYKLSIDQLNQTNDSLFNEINKLRKQLKIKNVKSIQHISSVALKKDTILIQDTIFNTSINIDTTINGEWYKLNMKLNYPNKIIVEPSFNSDKYIIVHSKKETINPPKKCWLLRLFQKKHTVLNVDVIEKNPYIKTKNNRYIEIIK